MEKLRAALQQEGQKSLLYFQYQQSLSRNALLFCFVIHSKESGFFAPSHKPPIVFDILCQAVHNHRMVIQKDEPNCIADPAHIRSTEVDGRKIRRVVAIS